VRDTPNTKKERTATEKLRKDKELKRGKNKGKAI